MSNLSSQLLKIAKGVVIELRSMSSHLFAIQEKVEAISKQQQPEKSTGDKPLAPIVSVLTTPTAIQVQAETHERKNVGQKTLERIGIIAVVAYAVLTYFTWREMKRSADAAADAVVEAEKSLNVTVANFRLEQRPWVNAIMVQLEPLVQGQPIIIDVTISNTGKTPALISTAKYTIRINSTPLKEFPELPYDPVPMGAIVTPGIPIISRCTGHKLRREEVDAITNGTAFLYIDGWFHYQDTFKERVSHKTGYCAIYDAKSKVFFQPAECMDRNYAD